ncbi:DUF3363 domain-containing protein [Hyphomonas oceanitis]|uniref:DUF3363 domain-containing protein n=1 Tax=Hyphomonas oceanitis TaxID=81033 RepID=UPI003002ED90
MKARIVRMSVSSAAALMAHVAYIKRDAALSEQDRGRLFDRNSEDAGKRDFVDAVSEDRHHFRIIVSPEDGTEMADLKPFVRDLVSQMEKDMETRLEWVGAIHHDTGRPHAHLIIRGRREDGRDLVMPREYISHGIRQCAEDLMTLELGPETALEQERKLHAEATAERLTRIDHFLDRQAGENHILELMESPSKYRTLHAARLRTLERLGLAEKLGAGRWELDAKFKTTLKSLGERGDIIKTMNRAVVGKSGRRLDVDAIFDRSDPEGRSLTGSVLKLGLTGEAHDRAYVIIDGLDGRAVYAELGSTEQLAEIRRGVIVTLSPPCVEPKPSDVTIDRIARQHGATYSASLHQADDPRASPEFIAAHVRRLEALRRQGHVERSAEANWTIPDDYLAKVRVYERTQARLRSVAMLVHSELGLAEQTQALGVTWLDETPQPSGIPIGFGREVADAQTQRRAFLAKIGIAANDGKVLTEAQRMELVRRDLAHGARILSDEIGKPYSPAPTQGHLEGIYREPMTRVSGKFAVIERSRDFTMVPWRDVLERSRGMRISGIMRGGSVSWKLGRGLGMPD